MDRVEDVSLHGFVKTINSLGVVFGCLALISSSPVIFGISLSFMIVGVVSTGICLSREKCRGQ
jgi:hypothetical protein